MDVDGPVEAADAALPGTDVEGEPTTIAAPTESLIYAPETAVPEQPLVQSSADISDEPKTASKGKKGKKGGKQDDAGGGTARSDKKKSGGKSGGSGGDKAAEPASSEAPDLCDWDCSLCMQLKSPALERYEAQVEAGLIDPKDTAAEEAATNTNVLLSCDGPCLRSYHTSCLLQAYPDQREKVDRILSPSTSSSSSSSAAGTAAADDGTSAAAAAKAKQSDEPWFCPDCEADTHPCLVCGQRQLSDTPFSVKQKEGEAPADAAKRLAAWGVGPFLRWGRLSTVSDARWLVAKLPLLSRAANIARKEGDSASAAASSTSRGRNASSAAISGRKRPRSSSIDDSNGVPSSAAVSMSDVASPQTVLVAAAAAVSRTLGPLMQSIDAASAAADSGADVTAAASSSTVASSAGGSAESASSAAAALSNVPAHARETGKLLERLHPAAFADAVAGGRVCAAENVAIGAGAAVSSARKPASSASKLARKATALRDSGSEANAAEQTDAASEVAGSAAAASRRSSRSRTLAASSAITSPPDENGSSETDGGVADASSSSAITSVAEDGSIAAAAPADTAMSDHAAPVPEMEPASAPVQTETAPAEETAADSCNAAPSQPSLASATPDVSVYSGGGLFAGAPLLDAEPQFFAGGGEDVGMPAPSSAAEEETPSSDAAAPAAAEESAGGVPVDAATEAAATQGPSSQQRYDDVTAASSQQHPRKRARTIADPAAAAADGITTTTAAGPALLSDITSIDGGEGEGVASSSPAASIHGDDDVVTLKALSSAAAAFGAGSRRKLTRTGASATAPAAISTSAAAADPDAPPSITSLLLRLAGGSASAAAPSISAAAVVAGALPSELGLPWSGTRKCAHRRCAAWYHSACLRRLSDLACIDAAARLHSTSEHVARLLRSSVEKQLLQQLVSEWRGQQREAAAAARAEAAAARKAAVSAKKATAAVIEVEEISDAPDEADARGADEASATAADAVDSAADDGAPVASESAVSALEQGAPSAAEDVPMSESLAVSTDDRTEQAAQSETVSAVTTEGNDACLTELGVATQVGAVAEPAPEAASEQINSLPSPIASSEDVARAAADASVDAAAAQPADGSGSSSSSSAPASAKKPAPSSSRKKPSAAASSSTSAARSKSGRGATSAPSSSSAVAAAVSSGDDDGEDTDVSAEPPASVLAELTKKASSHPLLAQLGALSSASPTFISLPSLLLLPGGEAALLELVASQPCAAAALLVRSGAAPSLSAAVTALTSAAAAGGGGGGSSRSKSAKISLNWDREAASTAESDAALPSSLSSAVVTPSFSEPLLGLESLWLAPRVSSDFICPRHVCDTCESGNPKGHHESGSIAHTAHEGAFKAIDKLYQLLCATNKDDGTPAFSLSFASSSAAASAAWTSSQEVEGLLTSVRSILTSALSSADSGRSIAPSPSAADAEAAAAAAAPSSNKARGGGRGAKAVTEAAELSAAPSSSLAAAPARSSSASGSSHLVLFDYCDPTDMRKRTPAADAQPSKSKKAASDALAVAASATTVAVIEEGEEGAVSSDGAGSDLAMTEGSGAVASTSAGNGAAASDAAEEDTAAIDEDQQVPIDENEGEEGAAAEEAEGDGEENEKDGEEEEEDDGAAEGSSSSAPAAKSRKWAPGRKKRRKRTSILMTRHKRQPSAAAPRKRAAASSSAAASASADFDGDEDGVITAEALQAAASSLQPQGLSRYGSLAASLLTSPPTDKSRMLLVDSHRLPLLRKLLSRRIPRICLLCPRAWHSGKQCEPTEALHVITPDYTHSLCPVHCRARLPGETAEDHRKRLLELAPAALPYSLTGPRVIIETAEEEEPAAGSVAAAAFGNAAGSGNGASAAAAPSSSSSSTSDDVSALACGDATAKHRKEVGPEQWLQDSVSAGAALRGLAVPALFPRLWVPDDPRHYRLESSLMSDVCGVMPKYQHIKRNIYTFKVRGSVNNTTRSFVQFLK